MSRCHRRQNLINCTLSITEFDVSVPSVEYWDIVLGLRRKNHANLGWFTPNVCKKL